MAGFDPSADGESPALGIDQAKRPTAQLLPEDAILLSEIVDQVFLVAVHPASDGEHEEVQSMWHRQRLPGRDGRQRPGADGFTWPRPLFRTIRRLRHRRAADIPLKTNFWARLPGSVSAVYRLPFESTARLWMP